MPEKRLKDLVKQFDSVYRQTHCGYHMCVYSVNMGGRMLVRHWRLSVVSSVNSPQSSVIAKMFVKK